MRFLYSALLIMFAVSAYCSPHKVPQQLVTLNHCWTEQNDIDKLDFPSNANLNDREWIKVHLKLVEQTLRARPTGHLTAQQKANRMAALDQLNSYWHTGSFPVNDQYNYRTPIFIDRYDNFCAVGYLVKATGHEDVSRMIAAQTNLAYVGEMNYPELNAWAKDYGFTVDELAWIQPTYTIIPSTVVYNIGKGANDEIYELYVDNKDDKLYVGGSFSNVDSSVTAKGIAYITDNNSVYNWHSVGDGLDGEVYAITEFANKLFAAGSISKSGTTNLENIAYWDGAMWNKAGCLDGVVKDLIVFENELYACGDFDICGGATDVNFARWNGTSWQGITGLNGRINKMYAISNELILGGYFDFDGNNVNLIKWYKRFGFIPYANIIENEVMDIQPFNGTYYVSCRATISNNNMVYYRSGTNWWVSAMGAIGGGNTNSFKTLCAEEDSLWMGGDFYYWSPPPVMMGNQYVTTYSVNLSYPYYNSFSTKLGFYIDGPINKMVVFKDALIGAGSFSTSYNGNVSINNIFRKAKKIIVPPPPVLPYTGYPINDKSTETSSYNPGYIVTDSTMNIFDSKTGLTQVDIYPNPAGIASVIIIENNFNASQLVLIDFAGRTVGKWPLDKTKQHLALPILPAGIYIARLSNDIGEQAITRLVIK